MATVQEWLVQRTGQVPVSSVGWFRAGVGFFNKKHFAFAVQSLSEAVRLDPQNYHAFQIMARALIALNRREDAIRALKESVKLENPTDWQLLVELTGAQDTVATSAAGAQLAAPPKSSPPPSPSAREAKTDESKGTR